MTAGSLRFTISFPNAASEIKTGDNALDLVDENVVSKYHIAGAGSAASDYITVVGAHTHDTLTVRVVASKISGDASLDQLLAGFFGAQTGNKVVLSISVAGCTEDDNGLQVAAHAASRSTWAKSGEVTQDLTASDFTEAGSYTYTTTVDFYVRADESNNAETSVGGTIGATLVGVTENAG